jgi:hypothetical protein
MPLIKDSTLIKSPPVWFWIVVFIISFSGMFYIGIEPSVLTNINKPLIYSENATLLDKIYLSLSSKWYYLLVGFNVLMGVAGLFYIVINLINLKNKAVLEMIGYKFTWSFLKIIPVLVLVPVMSFYFFSFGSIQDNVNSLEIQSDEFNKIVAEEVDYLYKSTQKLTDKYYFNQAISIAKFLSIIPEFNQRSIVAKDLVARKLACSIKINDRKNKLLANAKSDIDCKTKEYDLEDQDFLMKISMHEDTSISKLSDRTEIFRDAAKKSGKITVNSSIIDRRFMIDFSSTVLLTVISALLVVFKMIEDLMRPLNSLSMATREISKGNYDVIVNNNNEKSDVSGLIEHFNEMSRTIKSSREGLDTHNLYLETILKYSYGVIGLDRDRKIQLINPKIEMMLSINDSDEYIGLECQDIVKQHSYLQSLFELTEYKFRQKIDDWNEEIEISLPSKTVLLICQGTALKVGDDILGYVIVIDDISELHKAQKSAAWGEVALRMAHEIKNPLTPILLSAQRLRNRFIDSLKSKDLEVIDKTTNTIIEQVKSMDAMVSSFAEYANTPEIRAKLTNLNKVVVRSIELYDVISDATINLNLANEIPKILIDSSSIDRVIINLIKNSCESVKSDGHVEISITTEYIVKKKIVRLCIQDDGAGFDKKIINKVFEPYITTKQDGTGLGMAIVQNIIMQHGAVIRVKNVKPSGALIVIDFNCV